MRRIVYRPSARRDLFDIAEYITGASGNTALARRLIADLRAQCAKLAGLPGTLGRPRPELRPDLRSFPCRGYIILFRYHGNIFEVVNVIEGHRDLAAQVEEDDPEGG